MNAGTVEDEPLKRTGGWAGAELRGDATFLADVLTEDFIGIGPLGFMLTKRDWLERHRSGDLTYTAFELDEVGVRVYGDTALVTCRQTQQATYRGASTPGQLRASLMWVKQGGRWRLAGLQLCAMGRPPIPPQP
jgi:ketosteroid isomerase-like protein